MGITWTIQNNLITFSNTGREFQVSLRIKLQWSSGNMIYTHTTRSRIEIAPSSTFKVAYSTPPDVPPSAGNPSVIVELLTPKRVATMPAPAAPLLPAPSPRPPPVPPRTRAGTPAAMSANVASLPAMTHAEIAAKLRGTRWTLEQAPGGSLGTIDFFDDSARGSFGLRGLWQMTGPNTITWQQHELTFDAGFQNFTGWWFSPEEKRQGRACQCRSSRHQVRGVTWFQEVVPSAVLPPPPVPARG
jgi:hypothetical protein